MTTTSLLSVLVIGLAGFVHGMTGFGFGLTAMPLLPLLMNLKDAVPLVVVLTLVASGVKWLTVRDHFSWRQGLGLVLGSCVGIPFGIYALVRLDETVLRHILGVVMLLVAVHDFVTFRKGGFRIPRALGFPLGVASGGLAGAFNMGGPPAIAFVYSQPWSREQIASVLQVVFLVGTVLRLLLFGSTGLLDGSVLKLAAWAVLPMVLALLAGSACASRIPLERLKKGVSLFLGLMGVKYLLCG